MAQNTAGTSRMIMAAVSLAQLLEDGWYYKQFPVSSGRADLIT